MCAVFFIVLFVVVHSLPLCDMTQPNEYNDGKWILLDKIANSTTRFESSLKDTPILCKKVLRQSQQARVCAHHVDTVLPMEFFPRNCELAKRVYDTEFWQILGNRRLVFVGDSLTLQHFQNLACSLEMNGARFASDEAGNMNLTMRGFVGEVHMAWAPVLFECSNCSSATNANPFRTAAPIEWGMAASSWRRFLQPNSNYNNANNIDADDTILFINTGLWFGPVKLTQLALLKPHQRNRFAASEALFRKAVDQLFDTTLAGFRGQVVIRSISPGHANCRRLRPLRNSVAAGAKQPLHVDPYGWSWHTSRNTYLRKAARRHRALFLDIFTTTQLRPDTHPAVHYEKYLSPSGEYQLPNDVVVPASVASDCLHFCSQSRFSILNHWDDLLVSLLKAQLSTIK